MSSRDFNYSVKTGTDLLVQGAAGADYFALTSPKGPVDLSDAALKALVKANEQDADEAALAEFEITVVDAAAGHVRLRLPVSEVAKLPPGEQYPWDLHVTLPLDHPDYPDFDDIPMSGYIAVTWSTTHSTS